MAQTIIGLYDANGNLTISRWDGERASQISRRGGPIGPRRQENQYRVGIDVATEEEAIARIEADAQAYTRVEG